MRSIAVTVFLLLALPHFVSGQNDQEALKILDSFANKALKAPSITMKFNLVNSNQMDNSSDSLAGSVIISKDKYRLDLPDNIIWFNGEISWSYLPAEKEVTITKADRKDNTFQSRPSLIFSAYKKGYKNRLVEEKSDSYVIDMYPEDIKSELVRIRLTIGKSQLNLISLEYKKKDGTIITLHVKEYDLKAKLEPLTFVYQPDKYKDVEVIDMR